MRIPRKKNAATVRVPRARGAHGRQRQRLIDACISALHIYGPSRTTVEKVVGIAKMSPGIVRFYFASKAAMLVASLQFLATEFEEQVLIPVARLKGRPVAALELMVDLYLDPDIASPRKVSVWYAFWGEASSRQEYYDICGQKDESFAALVRELVGRLIVESGQQHLDADGVALGLIGSLEILWQDFAFQQEGDIDRIAAKNRCMAYLRSVFPGQFGVPAGTPAPANDRKLAAWVYDSPPLFALEREALFAGAWQFVGHLAHVEAPGDFIAVDLGIERVLVLRDAAGHIRAFRNSCTEAPHILAGSPRGRITVIECAVHGLQFELDGRGRGARGAAALTALAVRTVGDLILVRLLEGRAGADASSDSWGTLDLPRHARPAGSPSDTAMAADWKLIVEHWLESPSPSGAANSKRAWSARHYRHLLGDAASTPWAGHFLLPNHLLETRPDGFTVLQVLPVAPGRSLLRQSHYTICEVDRVALAAQYLASRLTANARASTLDMAESTQTGLVTFGHEAAGDAASTPAAAAFRRQLLSRVPAMGRLRYTLPPAVADIGES